MFCSVVVLLLFVVVAGCTNKGHSGEINSGDARKEQPESTLLENLQADLPQPTEAQFSTPESVVEAFFEAVNDHNFDSALKCFPVVEKYRANTVDNYFSILHTYELQADAPIPSFESHNFFKVFWNMNSIGRNFICYCS